MTEKEKMINNKLYNSVNSELQQGLRRAHDLCRVYNSLFSADQLKKDEIISELIPNHKDNLYIEGPFYCDYGYNITVGNNFYANYNLTILDTGLVTIGDNVFIGPNCSILCPIHPLLSEERNPSFDKETNSPISNEYSKNVTIKDNVWIASNVTILPGVTINDNVVIGAGSVVTKDIPSNTLAAGNPCKVIREITTKDSIYLKKELF